MEDLKLGRAMLIAPLVTPVLYIIGVYLFSRDVPAGIKDVLSALLFVSAFALPISYVCTIVIGLPVLIWLKNNNALTVTTYFPRISFLTFRDLSSSRGLI